MSTKQHHWPYTSRRFLSAGSFSSSQKKLDVSDELLSDPFIQKDREHLIILINGKLSYLDPLLEASFSLDKQLLLSLSDNENDEIAHVQEQIGYTLKGSLQLQKSFELPIHIINAFDHSYVAEGNLSSCLLEVQLAAGVSATLYETHRTFGDSSATSAQDSPLPLVIFRSCYSLGERAALVHIKTCSKSIESSPVYHLSQTRALLSQQAAFKSFLASSGSQICRCENWMELLGEGAQCEQYGFAFVGDKKHVDFATRVHHAHSNTTSKQLYKSLAKDTSVSAFAGLISIPKGSCDIKASQLSKNLLLSHEAKIYAKPELEIKNNQVKCSHGATVSQLRDEELFYLKSRGISDQVAKKLLIKAFAKDVLQKIASTDFYSRLIQWVDQSFLA